MEDNKLTQEQQKIHDDCHKAEEELRLIEKEFLALQSQIAEVTKRRSQKATELEQLCFMLRGSLLS